MSVEIICEVATNHGGDVQLAKRFIEVFADAGANFVKFQYTRVAHLRKDDPQYDWFQKAELSDDAFVELRDWCETCGTKLLLTVYNAQDVAAVKALTPWACKIGSGEAGSPSVIEAVEAAGFGRVIIATGLRQSRGYPWEPLRCVTRYPAPLAFSAKLATGPYGAYYGYVGWSDHCVGIDVCCSAILAGARIIETHVWLDKQARVARDFEKSDMEIKLIREFADNDPAARFIGRWQA